MHPPRARPARRALLAAALCLPVLGGCALVSQKTFNRHAGDPPRLPQAPPPPVPGMDRPALVTIVAGTPQSQWRPAVMAAVTDALARKPNALFTIVVNVPDRADGTPGDLSGVVAASGQPVLQAVMDAGAGGSQTEMDARTISSGSAMQVCIYVE
ncbi:hypothetical protein CFR78_06140 [Komagataeibacter rhaeticus]|uniref:Uncharacterized protein n=2 Tax=Komagataeibacter rhaeticus TaxID=215221 RepID=A0A181C7T5_9PROT|nr:hypothetical protein [Komagataeibacter rhaeticus]ATU73585.1 hypothetical protein CT154_12905 [Komagataeibacter xylinus]KDU95295.1 hypothetical protein GLUCORHAEAF1_08705 [Komagataeibacter rhaeticus AF1]MBL7240969.1 hypothetical protein [Komagataeibacter rhaeticus]PYD53976.1 hypothetical protein CFR78_06140 [Komagataeibacter rhaeticus]QIP34586.1 hypothetical protein GWK63_02960 [Komagataeibacter rhaeticus]